MLRRTFLSAVGLSSFNSIVSWLLSWEMYISITLVYVSGGKTYSEVAVRATELVKVLIGTAHNDLLHLDLSAVAESDSQIRESGFVKPLAGVHGDLVRSLGRALLYWCPKSAKLAGFYLW